MTTPRKRYGMSRRKDPATSNDAGRSVRRRLLAALRDSARGLAPEEDADRIGEAYSTENSMPERSRARPRPAGDACGVQGEGGRSSMTLHLCFKGRMAPHARGIVQTWAGGRRVHDQVRTGFTIDERDIKFWPGGGAPTVEACPHVREGRGDAGVFHEVNGGWFGACDWTAYLRGLDHAVKRELRLPPSGRVMIFDDREHSMVLSRRRNHGNKSVRHQHSIADTDAHYRHAQVLGTLVMRHVLTQHNRDACMVGWEMPGGWTMGPDEQSQVLARVCYDAAGVPLYTERMRRNMHSGETMESHADRMVRRAREASGWADAPICPIWHAVEDTTEAVEAALKSVHRVAGEPPHDAILWGHYDETDDLARLSDALRGEFGAVLMDVLND